MLGHKVGQSVGWLLGFIGLTYVELGIQSAAPGYYGPMFASVLVINTMFAIDAWNVAKQQAP